MQTFRIISGHHFTLTRMEWNKSTNVQELTYLSHQHVFGWIIHFWRVHHRGTVSQSNVLLRLNIPQYGEFHAGGNKQQESTVLLNFVTIKLNFIWESILHFVWKIEKRATLSIDYSSFPGKSWRYDSESCTNFPGKIATKGTRCYTLLILLLILFEFFLCLFVLGKY